MVKNVNNKFKIGSWKCKDYTKRYQIDKCRFNNCKKSYKKDNNN